MDEDIFQMHEQIQLLNKKRENPKSDSRKKNKKRKVNNNINNNQIIQNNSETKLEITKIFSDNEKENILLITKKTNIVFNTNTHLFVEGRNNNSNIPPDQIDNPYYIQRYYFFSLYDSGIQMDKESWYSVTPEEISQYISSIIPNSKNSTILDGFCGCGGNTIYFSKNLKTVYANDLFETKINMTKNNAKIYNCPENIIYLNQDFLNLNSEKVDFIFLSPPWGGPEYKKETLYSLKQWITPDFEKIINKSLSLSKNLIFYLPRNTDLNELAKYLIMYDKNNIKELDNTILFDVRYLNSAGKIKAILILYGEKFNNIKIKLIREQLINLVYKNDISSKSLIKKQINILRVIGYSKYIRIFNEYKEKNLNIEGDEFLNGLEKHFEENILDDDEKSEYINLCINKDNNEKDYSDADNDDNDKKIENNIQNEFIDLRGILSEENFNKVNKDYYYL